MFLNLLVFTSALPTEGIVLISPADKEDSFVTLSKDGVTLSKNKINVQLEKNHALYKISIKGKYICSKNGDDVLNACDGINDKGDKFYVLDAGDRDMYSIKSIYELDDTDEPKCLERDDKKLKLKKCGSNKEKQMFKITKGDEAYDKNALLEDCTPKTQKVLVRKTLLVCNDPAKCGNSKYIHLPYLDGI